MTKAEVDSVEAYIAKKPREVQPILQRVRRVIGKGLPGAEETISYAMPTYKLHGEYVVYFAGWKHHWSLYPVTETVRSKLASELASYEVRKGTVRFPLAEPMPTRLVERIVRELAKSAEKRRRIRSRGLEDESESGRQGVAAWNGSPAAVRTSSSSRPFATHSTRERGVVTPQEENLIAAWRTNNQATAYLVQHLPAGVWARQVPGIPRLTVGMIAAHIHNSRCRWIKSLGAAHGVSVPHLVDLRRVQPAQLARALSRSSQGMIELIRLGIENGGRVPRATWQNFPTDLEHFLSYFAAHEGHHRGQLCMAVRQLGQRLPRDVANGIWQWTRLARG